MSIYQMLSSNVFKGILLINWNNEVMRTVLDTAYRSGPILQMSYLKVDGWDLYPGIF